MSSRIIRVPSGAAVQAYQWERLSQGPPRHATAPLSAPPSEDAARLQREFEARLHAEREQAARQGEAQGRQAALQQLESELLRLARSVEELAGYKQRLRAQAEGEVLQLSLAIARRILGREIHTDPEAILGLVKAALERVSLREVTEVRVAPTHEAPLSAHLARIGAPAAIRVVPDPALEPGALLLQTTAGVADASIQTQLEEITRGFADALGVVR